MLYQFDLAGMLKTWCNPSNAKFFLKTRFTVGVSKSTASSFKFTCQRNERVNLKNVKEIDFP